MRVLISGATGLIGRRLGTELVRRGHEVVVFSRRAQGVQETLPFPCEVRTWNPEKDFASEVGTIDAVVNLAGTPVAGGRWSTKVKKEIRESRTLGTKLLARLAQQKGAKVFVNASAIGFYGDRADEVLDEASTAGQGFLSEVCQAWERSLFESAFEGRKCAVRVGVVIARQGGALDKMLPIFLNGGGGRLGNGRQYMSWIHIDDIVRIFAECVTNSRFQGIINGVAPEPATNSDFTRALSKALDIPAVLPAPSFGVRAAFGEMADVVLGSQRVVSKKLEQLGYQFQHPKLQGALDSTVSLYRGGVRLMESAIYLDHPIEKVWPFFSSERNLESITPETLSFHVLSKSTPQIQKGTLIDYKLKIRGVPASWQTEILEWDPPHQFVDFQRKGPYALWHHRHSFEKLGNGTLMTDLVQYKLPMGILGRLVAGAFVASDVRKIFDFRTTKMFEVFPNRERNGSRT